jgi:hypothetical protein
MVFKDSWTINRICLTLEPREKPETHEENFKEEYNRRHQEPKLFYVIDESCDL